MNERRDLNGKQLHGALHHEIQSRRGEQPAKGSLHYSLKKKRKPDEPACCSDEFHGPDEFSLGINGKTYGVGDEKNRGKADDDAKPQGDVVYRRGTRVNQFE